VDGRIVAIGEDPLAVFSFGESAIEEDHRAAVSTTKTEVTFIPGRLFEPAEIGLPDLHRTSAASANDCLCPLGSDGNDFHDQFLLQCCGALGDA